MRGKKSPSVARPGERRGESDPSLSQQSSEAASSTARAPSPFPTRGEGAPRDFRTAEGRRRGADGQSPLASREPKHILVQEPARLARGAKAVAPLSSSSRFKREACKNSSWQVLQ